MRNLFFTWILLTAAATLPRQASALEASAVSFEGSDAPLSAVLQGIEADAKRIPAPQASAVPSDGDSRPIIVAVSGLSSNELGVGLELKHLLAVWKFLFPGKAPNVKLLMDRLDEMHREMRADLDEETSRRISRRGNDYLAEALRGLAQRNGLELEIQDMPWSRDPENTKETVELFKKKLLALQSASPERPLYIVAHSWGSVLMHDALNALVKDKRPVKVRRLTTVGSPLVPQKLFVRIFKDIQIVKEKMQTRVKKPASVQEWVNIWAEPDMFSNTIASADKNLRIDEPAVVYEKRLNALLDSGSADKKQVKKDLKALQNSIIWHEAYHDGFEMELRSLSEHLRWDFPQQNERELLP
ncbi:MAG: hypothetical protein WCU88_12045 [Elusimicrobiota bacterium]|jgi:hypothetical protein